MQRDRVIVRTSVIGILANAFLSAFKAAVGLLTGSIAITLDAVNNLSDALSSVITIVGTRLAGKKADREHPLGHGRIEYITASIIAVIVLYAGVTSLVESIRKIINPTRPDYSAASLAIVAVAVLVKVLLGRYVSRVGKRVKSDSLIASGKDATLDSIISASTLAAAVVFLLTRVSLEAWLGAVISLVIIRSGIGMLRDSFSVILGERVDSELAQGIKATVCGFPEVHGAYDLILHNYGPDMMIGSVHIEVPDTMTADQLDPLEREIARKVLAEHHVFLVGISVYSMNTRDIGVARMHREIRRMVMSHDFVLQMHGFYASETEKVIRFDIVIDYAAPDRVGEYHEIVAQIQQAYPDYHLQVSLDVDISD